MIDESLIIVYADLINKRMTNLFTRKPWQLEDVPEEYRNSVASYIGGGSNG